jgi:hypothetical protein
MAAKLMKGKVTRPSTKKQDEATTIEEQMKWGGRSLATAWLLYNLAIVRDELTSRDPAMLHSISTSHAR